MANQKQIVLLHQNELIYSKEFLQLKIPRELLGVFWVTVSLVVSVFVFLFFGKVDEVIKVSGIVKTKENVSVVNNVIDGTIIQKNYKPDQKVKKGMVLYSIDPTIFEAQRESLLLSISDEEEKLRDLEQLELSFNNNANYVDKDTNPIGFSRFETYLSQVALLELQIEKNHIVYEEELNNPKSLRIQKNIDTSLLDFNLAKAQLINYKASFIERILNEKNEVKINLSKAKKDLIKLDEQNKFHSVIAPIDGYVQEISSLNIGDYVTSGKSVLNIIPNDAKNFRIELQLAQKDVGEIKEGLKVKYRFSAFPFFEYKGADGVIQTIDPDVRFSDNGSAYYCAYGNIDKLEFTSKKGKKFPIRAGLGVEARIVLETETIISFILKKMDLMW